LCVWGGVWVWMRECVRACVRVRVRVRVRARVCYFYLLCVQNDSVWSTNSDWLTFIFPCLALPSIIINDMDVARLSSFWEAWITWVPLPLIFYKYCNDAPWKNIVLTSKTNSMRPIYRGLLRKLTETANAHDWIRTPPIGIPLDKTPLRNYSRRVGKTNDINGRNRKTPEIFEHTILSYKKTIFWRRFHFARRPASRTAESTIPSLLRFLEPTSQEWIKGSSVFGLCRAFSIAYSPLS